MPIYVYRCSNCGIQFEHRQKFSDDPLTICPECEENALRKVYLPVGIVFKGSGFYSTDNRSSSRTTLPGSKSGSEDKPSEGKKPKESSPSSESKTEKKSGKSD